MTKEERAFKKYPIKISEYSDSGEEYDFNESDRLTYLEGLTDQQKIDIEDRFGTINHIKSVLNSIISNADTMTSGNVAHHRASIKLLAEGLLNYTKIMEE